MSRFLDPKLSTLVPYTPGEQPKGVADLLKLNTNENPYPPSPAVKEVLDDFDWGRLARYPDPDCAVFKDALAECLTRGSEQGPCAELSLSRSNFTVGNGSDELLAFIFHGLCGKGVSYLDISYSFYPVLADLLGVAVQTVALDRDFRWAPEAFLGIEGTLVITNPNAPTGIAAPLADIAALLEQDRERLVVVDEAYVDFHTESALALLPEHDNLLVVRTLSKSRNLAGMRAAFAVGSPEVIADLEAIRFSFNPYNLDQLALVAAAAAIRDQAWFRRCCDRIVATRDWTARRLEDLGCTVLPSATNFLFVAPPGAAEDAGATGSAACVAEARAADAADAAAASEAAALAEPDATRELALDAAGRAADDAAERAAERAADYAAALRARGIIVRYFKAPRVNAFVRVSIGTQEDMKRFVAATEKIFEEGL